MSTHRQLGAVARADVVQRDGRLLGGGGSVLVEAAGAVLLSEGRHRKLLHLVFCPVFRRSGVKGYKDFSIT
jgi:hypothetical protein